VGGDSSQTYEADVMADAAAGKRPVVLLSGMFDEDRALWHKRLRVPFRLAVAGEISHFEPGLWRQFVEALKLPETAQCPMIRCWP
jgi:hypothetical protein